MKLFSFVEEGRALRPVEVEISLLPGLPGIRIIGLPDTAIRESENRIRSALYEQGFRLPKGRQVLINLRPSRLHKRSQGIDLAIAAAILWRTGQVGLPTYEKGPIYAYGELGLAGDVRLPGSFSLDLSLAEGAVLYLGAADGAAPGPSSYRVSCLRDLAKPEYYPGRTIAAQQDPVQRPDVSRFAFSPEAAELLAVVALGEHSTLFAGPPGSGKSTAATAVHSLLAEPDPASRLSAHPMPTSVLSTDGSSEAWRPLVAPHHTTPVAAMVGGGISPAQGEISRAHGGVLLLEEFLEFRAPVREALREPCETGSIVVARQGRVMRFPADFLLLATTNLCPCGRFVPGRSVACRRPLTTCRSVIERLSGPMADRFQVLAFTQSWTHLPAIQGQELLERVNLARRFAHEQRGERRPSAKLDPAEVEGQMSPFTREHLIPSSGSSRRRRRALLLVARSLADLDQSNEVEGVHLEKAYELTVKSFFDLSRVFA